MSYQALEEALEEIDPATLQDLLVQYMCFEEKPEQLVKLEQEVAKTDPAILAQLGAKPLLPTTYQPIPPPRQRQNRKIKEVIREFGPSLNRHQHAKKEKNKQAYRPIR